MYSDFGSNARNFSTDTFIGKKKKEHQRENTQLPYKTGIYSRQKEQCSHKKADAEKNPSSGFLRKKQKAKYFQCPASIQMPQRQQIKHPMHKTAESKLGKAWPGSQQKKAPGRTRQNTQKRRDRGQGRAIQKGTKGAKLQRQEPASGCINRQNVAKLMKSCRKKSSKEPLQRKHQTQQGKQDAGLAAYGDPGLHGAETAM